MHVLVKEIYDMVPLESGEEDIESDGSDIVRNNGKVVNATSLPSTNKEEEEPTQGGKSRKNNKVDHADDS